MNPVEQRYNDAITLLGWLSKDYLPLPMRELLQQVVEKLETREAEAAHDLCRQALNQVSPTSVTDLSHASAGYCRVHLGAAYYARGDGFLHDAIEAFSTASRELSAHRRAQAVAEFGLGATYALLGEQTKAYEHITQEVLGALKWYPAAKDVDQKWAEIRGCLVQNGAMSQGAASLAKPPAPPGDIQASLHRVARRKIASAQRPEKPLPLGVQLLPVAGIILIAVTCGLIVGALTGTGYALVVYLVAWAISSYILLRKMRHIVPPGHALIVEKLGEPRVVWGPTTCYCWPFIERAHASVPLGRLQYTTPKKTISLTTDETIDLRLSIYYGVVSASNNGSNVLNAIYQPAAEARSPKDSSQSKPSKVRPLDVTEVRRSWESRLLSDITMTLNEVLPGWTRQRLSGDEARSRKVLINWLRTRLEERVKQWGMGIEELNIIELNKAKT